MAAIGALTPMDVANPLAAYPNRDWEKVYRNLYKHDSSFVFMCAPNDTHNCLLRGFVKNGVVTRIGPSWGYNKATDLAGNKASARWDPRCCQKGIALARRFYGDRRIKEPLVRQGMLDWLQAGKPRGTDGAIDLKYLKRGHDSFVPVTWEKAFEATAETMVDIAKTYNGKQGQEKLLAQGYDPLMVETTGGAGTQVMKFRGGMPLLGLTRVMAQYRLANSMALLDSTLRGVGPDQAVGARGFDNYSWHTDLPPGHPMVTGQQTNDFDLCMVEHSKMVIVWGMNWIATKMPDSHWLTEARMKGTKVVVIACEYSATANKSDELIVVRPGTTPALALGLAQVIMSEKLYDDAFVRRHTDLPLLIRLDNGKMLRAAEVFPGYQAAVLTNGITLVKTGEKPPSTLEQSGAFVSQEKRAEWGDYVAYDDVAKKPVAVNRDQVGDKANALPKGLALDIRTKIKLAVGGEVECATVWNATKQMLDNAYTPDSVEKLTWAKAEAIQSLARQIAVNSGAVAFACGMGPNQFFNSDLKDRGVFLVAALTGNVGKKGGNVGSYAGNYRIAYMSGLPQYILENPFDIELDPTKPARSKRYWKPESVHYFNHGDMILRKGKAVLTGKTHLPTPTKSVCVSNSNSLIGNVKGHYDFVINTLKRVELIAINEWWWTASCEYADVVFPVDSWAEFRYPDMTMSVTNPFVQVFPTSPLPRIHNTRGDIEVAKGLGEAIGKLTNDSRHADYWKFINEKDRALPYLQRMMDQSNAMRGYKIEALEKNAELGIPAILNTRTYPKYSSFEQIEESKPWYTKTGRLEFYREEAEFQDAGENVVIHREPIDSTPYDPASLVSAPHPLLRPKSPEDYGTKTSDRDADSRQARHVIYTTDELLQTAHPLTEHDPNYRFVFHTPKYRHGAHSTPVDLDIIAVWFGPFGDMHRRDKRMPFVNEAYVDINPLDGKSLGVEDGDYVFIDADPHDRPFKGWQNNPEGYAVARLIARARYYPGTPRGITRMWHNMYGATFSSVAAAKVRADGLAKSKDTNYQASFRSGSHQSCTRGWLKPTWMTDSLVVKELLNQGITQGFVPDVHCPVGAPRESMVRITKAENGGLGGEGIWSPETLGYRPTYESDAMKKFILGGFVTRSFMANVTSPLVVPITKITSPM